jgi:hypothetical protein
MESTFETVLYYISSIGVIAIDVVFGGAMLLVVGRIIYKAIRPAKKGDARNLTGDFLNIWDPITGVPRNIVGKEEQVWIEEYERGDGDKK